MANTVYPKAKEAMLSGDVDVVTGTVKVQMYDDDAVYDEADEFLADVTGTKAGAAVTVTGKAITDGELTGTLGSFNPPGGYTVASLVVYLDTGVDATSRLLAWLDTKGDTTALEIVTTGGVIQLHWNDPLISIGG